MTYKYPITSFSDLGRIRKSESGSSSVEFAILAPVLCFALLGAVDLGTAISERISMSHVVRSAAQVAMEDPGEAKVELMMNRAAAQNFNLEESSDTTIGTDQNPITLSVDRFCACPEAAESAVSCSTVCTGTVPTYIFYEMSAAKDFAGVLVPSLPLEASAQVQVR